MRSLYSPDIGLRDCDIGYYIEKLPLGFPILFLVWATLLYYGCYLFRNTYRPYPRRVTVACFDLYKPNTGGLISWCLFWVMKCSFNTSSPGITVGILMATYCNHGDNIYSSELWDSLREGFVLFGFRHSFWEFLEIMVIYFWVIIYLLYLSLILIVYALNSVISCLFDLPIQFFGFSLFF